MIGNFENIFGNNNFENSSHLEKGNLESERPRDIEYPPEGSIFDSISENFLYTDSDRLIDQGPII